MKNRKLLLIVSLVLALTMSLGGTLAYLTDTDEAVNVMTLGNVDIEQIEQEWNADGTALQVFTQKKPLYPYYGTLGWNKAPTDDDVEYRRFTMTGALDKYVSVKNTGSSEAYVRTIFAFEMGEFDKIADWKYKVIGYSYNNENGTEFPGLDWVWSDELVAEIEGQNYAIRVATHKDPVAAGDTTIPSLLQVYMNPEVGNEEIKKLDGNKDGLYEVKVLSQACQTVNMPDDAAEALNAAFGEVTAEKAIEWFTGMRPEVEVKGNNAAALTAAINEAPVGGVVKLTDDIDFGATTFTVEKAVTIDLNGKTVSSSTRNGTFYLKNGASLKNGTIDHNGTVAGIKVWQAESIEDIVLNLNGKSGSDNVITGISVQEGSNTYVGSLKNVTITGNGANKVYNGVETYNCGARDLKDYAIGSMDNVKVDVNGTALVLSAPAGTATNCEFKGGVYGINAHLKGTYNVSLKLVGGTIEGGTAALWAWDEPAPDKINSGSLILEAEDTTVTGEVVEEKTENFGDRWSVTGFSN